MLHEFERVVDYEFRSRWIIKSNRESFSRGTVFYQHVSEFRLLGRVHRVGEFATRAIKLPS